MNEIFKNYGFWDDYPEFPSKDWAYEVSNGDTRLGYWDWVVIKMLDKEIIIKP